MDWIENRSHIPGVRDGTPPPNLPSAYFNTTPIRPGGIYEGSAILIPNTTANWSSDPLVPEIIHDTRLLLLYYAQDDLDDPTKVVTVTKDLSSNAYIGFYAGIYYAFAWVTFSAGVGRCAHYNCIVSSSSAIQNSIPLELEPHHLTFQALSMASAIAVDLATQNSSLPYLWNNIGDYIEAILVRSYSAAWDQLNGSIRPSGVYTRYLPASPSLLAQVYQGRVYIWLVLQLLVTLLSILFMVIQSHLSKYPSISDASLIAFDLDTTAVAGFSINGVRQIEQRDGRFVVKDE